MLSQYCKQTPPPHYWLFSAQLRSSAGNKERPINMMERVVNLRPDDRSQTLVRCCCPSDSEPQEYEAPSSSSCTGNEMWNEVSRYNRRAVSSVHLLLKTDQRRDCLRGSSPRAVLLAFLLSYWHKLDVLGEKKCLFIYNLLFSDCAADVTRICVAISQQFSFNVAFSYYAPVFKLISPELM